ncbi:MAG: hypothetical protein KBD78_08220 [Oligoflexales bacterium]|nr:hypothetical protein [Oligoflexales bacterium]
MNELDALVTKFAYLENCHKYPQFLSSASEIEPLLIDIKNEVPPFVYQYLLIEFIYLFQKYRVWSDSNIFQQFTSEHISLGFGLSFNRIHDLTKNIAVKYNNIGQLDQEMLNKKDQEFIKYILIKIALTQNIELCSKDLGFAPELIRRIASIIEAESRKVQNSTKFEYKNELDQIICNSFNSLITAAHAKGWALDRFNFTYFLEMSGIFELKNIAQNEQSCSLVFDLLLLLGEQETLHEYDIYTFFSNNNIYREIFSIERSKLLIKFLLKLQIIEICDSFKESCTYRLSDRGYELTAISYGDWHFNSIDLNKLPRINYHYQLAIVSHLKEEHFELIRTLISQQHRELNFNILERLFDKYSKLKSDVALLKEFSKQLRSNSFKWDREKYTRCILLFDSKNEALQILKQHISSCSLATADDQLLNNLLLSGESLQLERYLISLIGCEIGDLDPSK